MKYSVFSVLKVTNSCKVTMRTIKKKKSHPSGKHALMYCRQPVMNQHIMPFERHNITLSIDFSVVDILHI